MAETRYPEISVSGSPRELGRQIGESTREQIQGFRELATQQVRLHSSVSVESARQIADDSLPFVEEYAPDALEELRGIAEAAGVSLTDLMLLQIRNQLNFSDTGCTSLSVAADCSSGRIVAQNWDSDPALDAFTVVLTRHPDGKPTFTTITQAGLIAYIGFNAAGIGVCLNTLPAPGRVKGVPHYFTVRKIYESSTLGEAVSAVQSARRAIPANIMMTTPEGPADLEVTMDGVRVLQSDQRGLLTHANHCEHPDLVEINSRFPEMIQSHARKQRIEELVETLPGSEDGIAQIQSALRDHQGYPRSICRHVNDDPETGFWQTVFSVLIEPEQRRMRITRGTPCEHPYEEYGMAAS